MYRFYLHLHLGDFLGNREGDIGIYLQHITPHCYLHLTLYLFARGGSIYLDLQFRAYTHLLARLHLDTSKCRFKRTIVLIHRPFMQHELQSYLLALRVVHCQLYVFCASGYFLHIARYLELHWS